MEAPVTYKKSTVPVIWNPPREHPKMYLPQLYPDPMIQSRSAARRAAQDLVETNKKCATQKDHFFALT